MKGMMPPNTMNDDATRVTRLTSDNSGRVKSPNSSFKNWYIVTTFQRECVTENTSYLKKDTVNLRYTLICLQLLQQLYMKKVWSWDLCSLTLTYTFCRKHYIFFHNAKYLATIILRFSKCNTLRRKKKPLSFFVKPDFTSIFIQVTDVCNRKTENARPLNQTQFLPLGRLVIIAANSPNLEIPGIFLVLFTINKICIYYLFHDGYFKLII